MSKADDINTLFRRFGGNADTYKEIVAAEHVGSARQKWPLLGQIRPQTANEPPETVKAGPRSVGSVVRQVQPFPTPPVDARAHAMAGAPLSRSVGSVLREEPEESVIDPAAAVGKIAENVPGVPDSEFRALQARPAVSVDAAPRHEAVSPRHAPGDVGDAEETDLQRLFRRMVAASEPAAPAAPPTHPLKRLVKW